MFEVMPIRKVMAVFFLSLFSMKLIAQDITQALSSGLNENPSVNSEGIAYILGTREGSLMAGLNDVVYAHGDWPQGISVYDIVRHKPIYAGAVEVQAEGDGGSTAVAGKTMLGHEQFVIATARLIAVEGKIATLRIMRSSREVRLHDFLLPKREQLDNPAH